MQCSKSSLFLRTVIFDICFLFYPLAGFIYLRDLPFGRYKTVHCSFNLLLCSTVQAIMIVHIIMDCTVEHIVVGCAIVIPVTLCTDYLMSKPNSVKVNRTHICVLNF